VVPKIRFCDDFQPRIYEKPLDKKAKLSSFYLVIGPDDHSLTIPIRIQPGNNSYMALHAKFAGLRTNWTGEKVPAAIPAGSSSFSLEIFSIGNPAGKGPAMGSPGGSRAETGHFPQENGENR
jgi:hypothetical protein